MAEIIDLNIRRSFQPSPLGVELPMRGGGGYDGGMEARVAKLEALAEATDKRLSLIESDVRDLRRIMDRDFRLTWGLILGGIVGLAGLLARGFGWI